MAKMRKLAGLVSVLTGVWWFGAVACLAQTIAPEPGFNTAALQLFVEPKGSVPMGSKLLFAASAQTPGFLLLFAVEPDGTVRQIFPHLTADGLPVGANDTTNALSPDKPMVVPDARNPLGNFELNATQRGRAAVIGVLSSQPLQLVDLADVSTGSGDVDSTVKAVYETIQALRIAPRDERAALLTPQWSMTALAYQVE
jgi:Domain of unknown function (DUF4384)